MIAALLLLLLAQAEPALPGAVLTGVLRSVKQDGPLTLPPEVQADLNALSRSGVCALPAKLDPKALHASGWR